MVLAGLAGGLVAQDPERVILDVAGQDQGPWGRNVRLIQTYPESDDLRDQVMRHLTTKEGEPLTRERIKADLIELYKILSIRATVEWRGERGDDQVDLFFTLEQSKSFDRLEFKGLINLTDSEARILTVSNNQLVNENDAEQMRLQLIDRYHTEGYYFVDIQIRTDDVERTLTFYVDEGPQVTVRDLKFRGNKSFPGETVFGYGQNLQGSAELENVPGVIWGAAFSDWKVEEDIQRVVDFYRREGYLNAEVHLEQRDFSLDRNYVDLTYRVDEGERFVVEALELYLFRSLNLDDDRPPRYSVEEVQEVIGLKIGDYFSTARINSDKRALEEFYGERGHPTANWYGQALDDLFRVEDPEFVYHESEPKLTVIYRVVEGEPKRLRDVRISGNTTTRDRVIRRRIQLLPGDVLDVTELDRSRQLLDATRYFQDPRTLSGAQFRLSPVEGSEGEVDLDVRVQEGETGSFVWGVGVSSGTGVQGNFQFSKQNFDFTRLPSSWNPGTILSEIADSKAFHGGGQSLELLLAPGTEVSFFRLSWTEPDLFRQHMDTIGLRMDAFKTTRILDTYNTDRVGGAVTVSRNFDDFTRLGFTFRDETAQVKNVDSNAPTIVFNNEGQTEIRGLQVRFDLSDLDSNLHPREGYVFTTFGEIAGGFLGATEDFYKVGAQIEFYQPLLTDALERKHVAYLRWRMDHADTFGPTDDLFPSERYFMGGSNLRGFDQRRAGPAQFNEPVGGTTMMLSTLEYQFPLVSTQMEQTIRHTEVIRGVAFLDFGVMGLDFDSTFRDPRLTVGFGVRIQVPVLQVPIQLDLAWPILAERTDREEQVFFSFRRF